MKQNIENLVALLSAQEESARAVARTFRESEKPDEEMAKAYETRARQLDEVLMLLKHKDHFNKIADIYLTSKNTKKSFVIFNNELIEYVSRQGRFAL